MKKSTPAWSFAGKPTRQITKIETLPGPGSYQPKDPTLDTSPRWGTTRSPRLPETPSKSPGPGSYSFESRLRGQTFGFSKAKRLDRSGLEDTPGPGAYSVELKKSSLNISLKNTRYEGKPNGLPGPGSYLFSDKFNSSPSYSVGKAVKLKIVPNLLPGPANYSLSPIKAGPSWKLGTEDKDNQNFCKTPGPGSYSQETKSFSPSFTMKSRYESRKREESPGPGSYSPSETEKRLKISVGVAEKMPFKPSPVPGPGSYSPSANYFKKLGSFSRTERRLIEVLNKTPGVGSYESKSTLNGPKFSLSSKHMLKDPSVPGPGSYTPKPCFKELPNVKIGKEKRVNEFFTDVPGPGSYRLEAKTDGPSWKFSKTPKHKPWKQEVPGPGDYEIKSTIPNVASYYNIT